MAELLPVKSCIDCLKSFLTNEVLLSPSTAAIFKSTVGHLERLQGIDLLEYKKSPTAIFESQEMLNT